MSIRTREVIYEPHPVSAERKEDLNSQGYRILDARFAPEGYVHPDKVDLQRDNINPITGEPFPVPPKPSEGLTADQIREKLTALGVEFKASASKAELAALLDENGENSDTQFEEEE